MKYVAEYRDRDLTHKLLEEIRQITTRPWRLMEVCGGQTHAILKSGLDKLLPPEIELVHGPGCPVCVTPLELIDKALVLAARPDVIFASFGDMLRVPGSAGDLFGVRAAGGDVRIIYSPLDALKIAQDNPEKTVVFFAIGFETTAPANAMAVLQAARLKLPNFTVLVSHVTVPAALRTLLEAPDVRVDAFLSAGHVNAVMGFWEYEPLVRRYGVPIVVTGFEPVDIARGVLMAIRQLESGRAALENAYERAVNRNGNQPAQAVISQIFELCDRKWRGIGNIPQSGYRLRPPFATYDAEQRFPEVRAIDTAEPEVCISGQVLQGLEKPDACPAFGTHCTPQTPLGATMVSAEGACAAYYRFRRLGA